MLTRRSLMLGGAAWSAASACGCCAHAQQLRAQSRGCYLASDDLGIVQRRAQSSQTLASADESTILRSGNPDFDRALAQTLLKLANAFDVEPGFAFFDDDKGKVAYATPARILRRSDGSLCKDGSVFFGIRYLKAKMATDEAPEVVVATVCAHEFGHILQFKRELDLSKGQTTVKRSELQADYFAGYFTGLRKLERPSYPAAVAAVSRWNVGDNNTWDPDHHGTPQERARALIRGYEAAYLQRKSLSEAIEESTRYVMTL